MGLGINLDVGNLLRNLPGVGKLLGGPDDPYGDWLLQQNYNSPLNQMKRLEEAGLNPNLIYANGVSNTATSAIRAKDGGLRLGIGYNTEPPNASVQRELLQGQLDLMDSRQDQLDLDNERRRLQNKILQKTLDFYENTGVSPADNPYVKLFGRLFSEVKGYDQETGNLSNGFFSFFDYFLNNLLSAPQPGVNPPQKVQHRR